MKRVLAVQNLIGSPRMPEGSPLLARDDHAAPSVFRPENMLREARRQKGLRLGYVPPVCILDPDGDIVRHVRGLHHATRSTHWACYHTDMWEWQDTVGDLGIVGSAVGGSFAVLVAEQLFASGCELLISIASAGKIALDLEASTYVLVDRALRDEGTSHHYLPEAPFVETDPHLLGLADAALRMAGHRVARGSTWTTDAPFRETRDTIVARRGQGILTVEMEAASLLAFGRACERPVLCLAHVTNQLGCVDGDFEKGEFNGAARSLSIARTMAEACRETVRERRSA
ncbi:nucleoside phosphorylase [Lichenifustis flavocetrariae]|uniref:Nucleoside phosphorylase n=1 Tax=Lichenifustis flavocetrariae TaxID=2949735 RepID=A0AA41Z2A7_9HYPH|nr:nucleoside phosphorylase [Lichenifustis flavocetrariae]MCW6511548.1 nucleoside phosphorylase [Lichenifustis flavocetrariae]